MSRKILVRVLMSISLFALAQSNVLACAACFGQSDSRMAQGMNMGIFALLLVITCVLGGVASFFVYLGKRSMPPHSEIQNHAENLSENSTNG